ncbi:DinB family protein [Bacillus sp. SM2101]|uniref:DinB family protein n=1 Tax=Bacillus sp. SM2101 TaxID=2805366 RepID=UPI001BDF0111|nr:DinB family protein [Bacillus sp. SM2101]
MTNLTNSQMKQWGTIRSYSKSFIKELKEEDLDRALPRKGLNTLRKHFEEMVEVQKDFVMAIGSSVMAFNSLPDNEIQGKLSKEELLEKMSQVDEELKSTLDNVDDNTHVIWFGEKQLLPYHLSSMIAHETMHIGQIIAFCYVLDIKIPEYIINSWALSGN